METQLVSGLLNCPSLDPSHRQLKTPGFRLSQCQIVFFSPLVDTLSCIYTLFTGSTYQQNFTRVLDELG